MASGCAGLFEMTGMVSLMQLSCLGLRLRRLIA